MGITHIFSIIALYQLNDHSLQPLPRKLVAFQSNNNNNNKDDDEGLHLSRKQQPAPNCTVQKGCRRRSYGYKDQLLINKAFLEEVSFATRRPLSVLINTFTLLHFVKDPDDRKSFYSVSRQSMKFNREHTWTPENDSSFYSPPSQVGPLQQVEPSLSPKVHCLDSNVERENHSQLHLASISCI